MGLIPRLGRSAGGGNDNPLQYSCPGNYTDRGAWRATVHGCKESDTVEWLRTDTHTKSLTFCSFFQSTRTLAMLLIRVPRRHVGAWPAPRQGSLYFSRGKFHLSIDLAGSVCFLSLPKSLLTAAGGPQKRGCQEWVDSFIPGGLPDGSRLWGREKRADFHNTTEL